MSARFFDRRLAREAARSPLPLTLTVALGLLGGVLLVVQARLLASVIARAFLGGAGLPELRPALLAFLVAAFLRALTAWGGEIAAADVAAHAKTSLRDRLFAHLLRLGPIHARGERTGELVNAATEGVEALDAYFAQYLPQIALAALVPLAVLVFVLPLDPLSGIILLVTAPLIPLFMVLIGAAADALTRRQWTALSRLSAHYLDVLQGLPTLKLFNRSLDQAQVIAAVSERHRRATLDVLRVAFLSALVLELLATLGTALVAVTIGLRLLAGRLTFEQALAVLILAPEFYLPLRQLAVRFHAGVAGSAAAARIFAILGLPPPGAKECASEDAHSSIQGKAADASSSRFASFAPLRVLRGPNSPPPTITLSAVTVRYDPAAPPALDAATLTLRAGQTLALAGPTGSGKSTVAALLLRFVAPASGEITADGAPLAAIPPADWRACVAWAPQRPHLFDRSAADNIRLGRPNASLEAVVAAARRAEIHDVLAALPQGYDTPLGERAARLSGGQAQRIALARAFLKDAPIVILDEPTAHLDPATEARLRDALARLLAGRTALVIAHRVNTLRAAHRVAMLDAGRLVEEGAPSALLTAGGPFARLAAVPPLPPLDPSAHAAPATEPDPASPVQPPAPDPVPAHASAQRVSSPFAPWFRFLLRALVPVWRWIVLSVLLGAGTVAAGIGLLATSAWLIARAAQGPSIAVLQVAIVGVRFFGITRALLRYLERLASHQASFRVLSRLRVWFYEQVEPLAPGGLARFHSADLMARAVGDIGVLENFTIRTVAPPAVAVLTLALLGLWLARFGAAIALCAVGMLAATGVLGVALAWALARGPGRRLPAVRAALHMALADGIQGMADLLAFDAAADQAARVASLGRDLGRLQRRMARVSGLTAALNVLAPALTAVALLVVAVPRVEGVNLAAIVLGVWAAFEAIWPLPAAAQHLETSRAAALRLLEIAAASPPVAESASSAPPPLCSSAPLLRIPVLSFHAVHFRYPSGDPVLHGVSFDVPAGACVAVVGPSGAGKSTLAQLAARFYEPASGRITLLGRDLALLAPEEARRQLAVLSQDAHLFNGTLRENLMLARAGASPADLDAVLRIAQLDGFVAALPHGLDTWIGEQGLRLSGGERQRLALARALLKDAPLLILDEPTSALDPATESALLDGLLPATKARGRTVLLITHRLAVARAADTILVLQDGRIVQRGSHAALIVRPGAYRTLWEAQQQELT